MQRDSGVPSASVTAAGAASSAASIAAGSPTQASGTGSGSFVQPASASRQSTTARADRTSVARGIQVTVGS